MVLYIIAVLPILFYVAIVKAMDGFSLASWKRLALYMLWGLMSCMILFAISYFTSVQLGWGNTFLEELLKCLPLIIAICRKKIAFFAEALIYGTAVGAGFALIENILYVMVFDDFTVLDAIVRGFGTAILHIGCSALYATLAITVARLSARVAAPVLTVLCFAAVFPSFGIHLIYNAFILPELLQMVLVVILMSCLFAIIYRIDNKLIHKWLDVCISNEISLLASIREGKLKETPAGEYLLEARRRFKPEVFFDICVFMGLYLELSIAAKSRMIMREAGMDVPVDEETHKSNTDKLRELAQLRSNIGITGMMVLRPIINPKATDEWALGELL